MTDAVGNRGSESPKEKAHRIWDDIEIFEGKSVAAHDKELMLEHLIDQLKQSSKKCLPNASAELLAEVIQGYKDAIFDMELELSPERDWISKNIHQYARNINAMGEPYLKYGRVVKKLEH